ncbi:hypothetical protein NWP96_06360 [Mycoplasmopsis cynos]|nr:hypothetical protein [Mycoplasmopsis cynos]MCU9936687.1 hypothetical protein [Mycoplasmopsis cynos]
MKLNNKWAIDNWSVLFELSTIEVINVSKKFNGYKNGKTSNEMLRFVIPQIIAIFWEFLFFDVNETTSPVMVVPTFEPSTKAIAELVGRILSLCA